MNNITNKEIKNIADSSAAYMLGVLSQSHEHLPSIGTDLNPITFSKSGDFILYYITPISEDPIPIDIIDQELQKKNLSLSYIGSADRDLYRQLPSEYFSSSIEDKKHMVENLITDKIILFKPKIDLKNIEQNKVHKNMEIVTLFGDKESKDLNAPYIPVPKINSDVKTFEYKLMNQQCIRLKDYPYVMEEPFYVICSDYIYANFSSNSWRSKEDRYLCEWINTEPNTIVKIPIDLTNKTFEKNLLIGTEHLYFINKNYLNEYIDKQITEDMVRLYEVFDEIVEEDIIDSDKVTQQVELDFLKYLNYYLLGQNLLYNKKDLVNFHVSVKTNFITVLSGMSGTGKTQLATSYANALNLNQENKKLLVIPISSSYTETGDILGYLNTTNGLYMPADTGLVDFLVQASKSDKMHIVVFDEMNLSQVEYWFSTFISILELKPSERKLRLYSDQICHNASKYPSVIEIKDNIRFVGTVNMDETTKIFSDRLLDRANVLTLNKVSFRECRDAFIEFEHSSNFEFKSEIQSPSQFGNHDKYNSWIKQEKNHMTTFSDVELDFFDKLHATINKYDEQKGFSFRIMERIANYISNIPVIEDESYIVTRKDAIDLQIKQRLLTKIRGPREQLEKLIGTINSNDDTIADSELYEFFNSDVAKTISDFSITLKEIEKKARELHVYDYAN